MVGGGLLLVVVVVMMAVGIHCFLEQLLCPAGVGGRTSVRGGG